MSPLKIGIVVGKFPTISETFIINQVAFLVKKGYSVDILCLGAINKNKGINKLVDDLNLLEHAIPFDKKKFYDLGIIEKLKKAFELLVASRFKRELLKSLNPFKFGRQAINFNQLIKVGYDHYFDIQDYDVIHIHFADYAVDLISQIKNFKKKVIVSFHGYDAHNFDKEFYSELSSISSIRYTCNTQYTADKINKLGFQKSKIEILPVGLDTNFFKPIPKTHDHFTIAFIGRLIPLKGVLQSIKIVHQLIERGHNVHYNIIGEGPEHKKCLNYIIENKLEDSIELKGSKTQKEIVDLLNCSDVFLFPGIVDDMGRCEAQGLVIQEAQAMELPVVISNVGGMAEGILDGQTGFVITQGDVEAYVMALEKLISDNTLRFNMGKRGREFVCRHYDLNILGDQLLNLYSR